MRNTLHAVRIQHISLISTTWHLQKFPLQHLIPNLEKPTGGFAPSLYWCLCYVGHCRQPQLALLELEQIKAMSNPT